ncbi:MAG: hypothetical protein ACYDA1_08385 [Vulcanimicrobiaceae bacterium]
MSRVEATSRTTSAAAVAPPDPASSAAQAAEEANLAIQHQAFDFETEERAEMQRESDALEALMLAQIKSEDAYMQKWIGLI